MNHHEYAKSFWNNVNTFRLKKPISWNALALSIGISPTNLTRYRKVGQLPFAYTIVDIADILECSLDDLLRV